MKFEKRRIADLLDCIIDNRGKTPPISDSGHCLMEINCIAEKSKYPNYSLIRKYVSEETYHTWFRSGHPQKGDILIPTVGTLDAISLMDRDDCCIAQNMIAFRVNSSICDNEYLYYVLCDPIVRKRLLNLDIGGVQPSIKVPHIKNLEINIPPLNVQKQMSSILCAIDEKLQINNRLNDNLAEQARALCNAWLIEYLPFGGSCPSDWVLTPLSSIANFIGGYSYKGSELQASSIAMATIKNFDRRGGFKLDGFKEITPSNKLKPEHHACLFDTLVAHTDLTQNAEVIGNAEPLLSTGGYDDIVFSMDVVKVIPASINVSQFLIAAILQTQQFKEHCLGYINGTTVLHLSKKALPDYCIMLPQNLATLSPLETTLSAIYRQMALKIEENRYLGQVRDSLLPRLMSGEIDVSSVTI